MIRHYEARQWGFWTFAAYLDDGTWFGEFVGTADTRREAEALARQAILDRGEHPFGYDVDGPTAAVTPAGPDRQPLTQQGERL